MTPNQDLINAILDRQRRGIKEADIKQEVLAAGHSEVVYEEALRALAAQPTLGALSQVPIAQLISFSALARETGRLLFTQIPVLLKTVAAGLLALAALFVVMEIVRVFSGTESETMVYVVWSVFPVAVSMVLSFTLIRALLKRTENRSYGSHLAFVLKQSWPLGVAVIAVTCVVMTGYMLFIIPGIFLTIYTFNAIFFVLDDKARGIDALVLSTSLTYGRFWPLLGRIFAIGVAFMVLMLGGIFLSLLTFILAPLMIALLFFFGYFALYGSYIALYESLRDVSVAKPLPIQTTTLKRMYAGITIVWVVISVALFALGTGGALLLLN